MYIPVVQAEIGAGSASGQCVKVAIHTLTGLFDIGLYPCMYIAFNKLINQLCDFYFHIIFCIYGHLLVIIMATCVSILIITGLHVISDGKL